MDTTRTYLRVMQGVLARSKSEFAAEQISDRALNKLSTLWESKLLAQVNEEREEVTHTTGVQHNSEDVKCRKRKCNETDAGKMRVHKKECTQAMGEPKEKTELDSTDSRGEALSSDSEDELEDVQTTNVLLGQFEKVTRTKSKWKCTLKDGVYTIDGRDVVFSRATGEFQWG